MSFPTRHSSRGASLIAVLVAIVLISLASLWAMSTLSSGEKKVAGLWTKLQASNAAAELVELFRSFTPAQMNAYLAPGGRAVYPLCSWIHSTDPATGTVSQPDPAAELVAPKLGKVARRYRVQVVDIQTLDPVAGACGTMAPYDFAANPNHRFLVTVAVDYTGRESGAREEVFLPAMVVD